MSDTTRIEAAGVKYHCVEQGCRHEAAPGEAKCIDHVQADAMIRAAGLTVAHTELSRLKMEHLCETPGCKAWAVRGTLRCEDHAMTQSIMGHVPHNSVRQEHCAFRDCTELTVDGAHCAAHAPSMDEANNEAEAALAAEVAEQEETIRRLEAKCKALEESLIENERTAQQSATTAEPRILTVQDIDDLTVLLKASGVQRAHFKGALLGNDIELDLQFSGVRIKGASDAY